MEYKNSAVLYNHFDNFGVTSSMLIHFGKIPVWVPCKRKSRKKSILMILKDAFIYSSSAFNCIFFDAPGKTDGSMKNQIFRIDRNSSSISIFRIWVADNDRINGSKYMICQLKTFKFNCSSLLALKLLFSPSLPPSSDSSSILGFE